jgi:hypothetical protein
MYEFYIISYSNYLKIKRFGHARHKFALRHPLNLLDYELI